MSNELIEMPEINYQKGENALLDMYEKLLYDRDKVNYSVKTIKVKVNEKQLARIWSGFGKYIKGYSLVQFHHNYWVKMSPAIDNSVPIGKMLLEDGWAYSLL